MVRYVSIPNTMTSINHWSGVQKRDESVRFSSRSTVFGSGAIDRWAYGESWISCLTLHLCTMQERDHSVGNWKQASAPVKREDPISHLCLTDIIYSFSPFLYSFRVFNFIIWYCLSLYARFPDSQILRSPPSPSVVCLVTFWSRSRMMNDQWFQGKFTEIIQSSILHLLFGSSR